MYVSALKARKERQTHTHTEKEASTATIIITNTGGIQNDYIVYMYVNEYRCVDNYQLY